MVLKYKKFAEERGVASVEAALIMIPCLFTLLAFFLMGLLFASMASVSSEVLISTLIAKQTTDFRNPSGPTNRYHVATPTELVSGHPSGNQANAEGHFTAYSGVRTEDPFGTAFANFVAAEYRANGDAFGVDPNAKYAQTSVEVAELTETRRHSVLRFFPVSAGTVDYLGVAASVVLTKDEIVFVPEAVNGTPEYKWTFKVKPEEVLYAEKYKEGTTYDKDVEEYPEDVVDGEDGGADG